MEDSAANDRPGEIDDEGSIEAVARAAAGGDRDAFRALVEATSAVVYRVALRSLGEPADADDVVQETYVRAWRSLDRLRDPAAVVGWLCRIAANVAADLHRSRGRRRTWSLDASSEDGAALVERLSSDDPDPEKQVGDAQLARAALALVGELSEKHRMVLLLREVDGMSYAEIAGALGLSVGTVESRLHRARAALARKIARLEAVHQREVS